MHCLLGDPRVSSGVDSMRAAGAVGIRALPATFGCCSGGDAGGLRERRAGGCAREAREETFRRKAGADTRQNKKRGKQKSSQVEHIGTKTKGRSEGELKAARLENY